MKFGNKNTQTVMRIIGIINRLKRSKIENQFFSLGNKPGFINFCSDIDKNGITEMADKRKTIDH